MSGLTQFAPGSTGAVYLPADGRRRGLVIVCHERYGLAQHTLDLAHRLADDGYVAIAPDFYADWDGDRDALAAGDIIVDLGDTHVQRHLAAAITYGVETLRVHPERVAVFGVCLSGSYGLLANEVHRQLGAVVLFYGGVGDADLSPDRERPYGDLLQQVTAPVLAIFGEGDHVYSVPDVRRFRGALEDAGVNYEMVVVPDVPHGFMNSTMPGRYRPHETEQSWAVVGAFLERAFHGGFDTSRREWSFRSLISCDYDFTRNVRLE